MGKLALLVIVALIALQASAPAQNKKKQPYVIEFDRARDVEQTSVSPDGKKKGIFVKVKFAITLDGSKVEKLDDDHLLIIEEDGHKVKEVSLPKPVASEALTVILTMDTSGSMSGRRIEQARVAADVFLQKLPARSDCGLILFDHEVRDRLPPSFDRAPVQAKIHAIDPRGGTAYLDATAEAIEMLRSTPNGRDRAIVLMTDGIDINSKKTIQQVIAQAKQERVRVYPIGIGEPGKLDPVNTVLVLDHSGSMKTPASDTDVTAKIKALHLAGERYVDSMSSVGRCSIIPFSSLVGTPRAFMDKTQAPRLKDSIRKLTAYGETAFYDATYEAIGVLEADNKPGKRAVITMTDGYDNTSRRRVGEVIDRAKEAGIPLYMLGFGRDGEIDQATMDRMAKATGGKYFHANSKDALLEIFEKLAILLHDDGIDEAALKQLARETRGQYFPAKNVAELKMILADVTQNIQRESYEIVFESLVPHATARSAMSP